VIFSLFGIGVIISYVVMIAQVPGADIRSDTRLFTLFLSVPLVLGLVVSARALKLEVVEPDNSEKQVNKWGHP